MRYLFDREGMAQIVKNEGVAGLYKGLVPLWSRQIPYTMMKFWAFERTVQALYAHVIPKPKVRLTRSRISVFYQQLTCHWMCRASAPSLNNSVSLSSVVTSLVSSALSSLTLPTLLSPS